MVIDQERTQFEAAMWTYYLDLKAKGWSAPGEGERVPPALFWREESGKYGVLSVEAAWNGWQMARKSSAQPSMQDALAAGGGTLHGAIDYWQEKCKELEAKLAQSAQPVAWRYKFMEDLQWQYTQNPQQAHRLATLEPLYAAAQPVEVQRVGLTEARIQAIWDVAAGALPGWSRHIAYARAIEEAHGIKPTSSEGGA